MIDASIIFANFLLGLIVATRRRDNSFRTTYRFVKNDKQKYRTTFSRYVENLDDTTVSANNRITNNARPTKIYRFIFSFVREKSILVVTF